MKSRFVLVLLAVALVAPACIADVATNAGVTFGMHIQGNTQLERSIVIAHADATTNHGLSWSVLEPAPDQWDFTYADAAYDFAVANNLQQTGMSFAWDQDLLDDLPAWVLDVVEPAELRQELRQRARRIFARYPLLQRINVVNEPLELLGGALYENHFYRVLGADYVEEILHIVDAEAPATTELIVNENFVEYNQAKADALVALVADLVSSGAPIDGVGLQSHFLFGEPDFDRYRQVMIDLGALGVDVHITELDVPVAPDLPDRLEVQARRYRQAIESCLAVDACRSIMVWGVEDGHTWVDTLFGPGYDPLLFTAQGRTKPAYAAVIAALAAGR